MSDIKQYEPLWGSWYIDSLLGEGAFGEVYKIYQENFGQTYYSAVKMISIPKTENEVREMQYEGLDKPSIRDFYHATVKDIISEITLMHQFRGNSNIVSFEDQKVIEKTGEIGWDILIRMELLTSLSDHAAQTPLSTEETIKLGIHICRALELCAQKNIVHRDIKPENIFLSPYGEYKLGDFGTARQIERTMSGLSKKGTYTYMAPEVFKGEPYNASVDTYSLGIVMYRFLNRNRTPFLPPFPNKIMPSDRDNMLQWRMNAVPIPPLTEVSPKLNNIVLKACAYNRQERFESPTEMRMALEAIGQIEYLPEIGSAGEAIGQKPLPTYNSSGSSKKNNIRLITVISSVAAALLLSITLISWFVMNSAKGIEDPSNITGNGPISDNYDDLFVSIDDKNTTSEDLASMINSGEIPLNVIQLSINDSEISDLAPLEKLGELENLSLNSNNISEISPLKSLPKLSSLDLSNNPITDFKPLLSLTNLTELSLENTQISDSALLEPLKNLQYLNLISCRINDFSFLTSLTGLQYLHLDDCNLRDSDITFIEPLTQLKTLALSYNTISDLTPLSSLTALDALRLDDNDVSDITPLGSLSELKILSLSNNNIRDFTTLSSLASNKISDISPPKSLPKLSSLDLSNNPITDFTPLLSLTNLTELSLEKTQISDSSLLKPLKNLQYLNLCSCRINDLSFLTSLTGLQYLYLDDCNLSDSDITFIEPLTQLQTLALSYNRISNLTPLASVTRLKELFLGHNQIQDISPLGSLIYLESLDLSKAILNDISPLKSLTRLINLYITGLSIEQEQNIKSALPNCNIINP